VIAKKKVKRISAFTLLFLILLCVFVWAEDGVFSPFIETFPKGKIDWDSGFFYGTGIGYPHMNAGSKARALRVAQAGALSAILQVASRLRVDDQHTLSDLEEKKVIIQIKGLIYYEPHEREFIKESNHPFYRVTYRAPIKGVKGLTKKLLTQLRSRPLSIQDFPNENVIDSADGSLPWLILDARGLQQQSAVQPALFPKIVTEEGETIYDLNKVEAASLVKNGLVKYVVSDKSHEEIGSLSGKRSFVSFLDFLSPPLAQAEEIHKRKRRGKYIIKNVSQSQGFMKTNLVISESDARDIRKEDASTQILKKCRVVVIVSSSIGGIEGSLLNHLALSP